MIISYLILASWLIALSLGVFGIVKRKKSFLGAGMVAALIGLGLTYYLKSIL